MGILIFRRARVTCQWSKRVPTSTITTNGGLIIAAYYMTCAMYTLPSRVWVLKVESEGVVVHVIRSRYTCSIVPERHSVLSAKTNTIKKTIYLNYTTNCTLQLQYSQSCKALSLWAMLNLFRHSHHNYSSKRNSANASFNSSNLSASRNSFNGRHT